jgi:hypothetical protein
MPRCTRPAPVVCCAPRLNATRSRCSEKRIASLSPAVATSALATRDVYSLTWRVAQRVGHGAPVVVSGL